ncbi:MAG: PAS domain S-box protein [Magnetococcales bacterium]|nr:PAS domain S-box protein [Magnetococcales bacterium]
MHGLPGSSFLGWAGDEKNQAIHTINILADIQKNRLLQSLNELRQANGLLAQDRYFKGELSRIITKQFSSSTPEEENNHDYLVSWLNEFQSHTPSSLAVHVIHPESNTVLVSTKREVLGKEVVDRVFIERITTTGQDYIGGFTPSPVPALFFFGSPVFLGKKGPIAVIVLEISLERFLLSNLTLNKGPWQGLETLLVNEHGTNLIQTGTVLERLGNQGMGAVTGTLKVSPDRIAASGQEGFIETSDRNQAPILAVYRHIRLFAEWGWGLVLQIKQDDLLRPMSTAFSIAWIMGFMATVVFTIVALILTRRLIRPLRQLTLAAQQLTQGHRHVRSHHTGRDEVGILARAFDVMADEVARTLDYLERSVARRTIALEQELAVRKWQQQQQKIIEKSLKESEQRYRTLVDTMTAGVIVYEAVQGGEDFTIQDLNRMGEQLTQVVKQEILGQSVTQVFPGVMTSGLFHVLQSVYRSTISTRHPVTLIHDQRLQRWFENRVYKLPSGDIVVIFDDISERKEAEDALKLVQFSVDNTHDAFLWFAEGGAVLRANRATLTLLSVDEEQLMRLTAMDLFCAMTPGMWAQNWQIIKQTGTLVTSNELCRPDGPQIPVEMSASYLKGEAGGPDSMFASMRDLTERNRAEKEKRTLELLAFHRERLATLGTLAAGMAHEINNPNNAIHFNAIMLQGLWPDLELLLRQAIENDGDFLLEGLPASESVTTIPRLLEGIRKSSERIQGIIVNLKHLSRQEQGPQSRPIDLKSVIKEAVAILQDPISRHTDHCQLLYSEESVMVLGHSQQLEQVFINLILNALQSLPNRSCGVTVTMASGAHANETQVIISDQGVGIPPENMPKLTSPFFTTKGDREGTGLGLSIANAIIENHGGRLIFVSDPRVGTTVTVILPTIAVQQRGDHP